jgi:hypothetical protein
MPGYTLYWTAFPADPKTFDIFTFFVKRLLTTNLLIDEINGFSAHDEEHQDSFTISEADEGFRFCRTKSLSFTQNVMRALIFMEELGMASEVSSNEDLDFITALDDVNSKIALNTYDRQKTYYLTLDPPN